MDVSLVGLYAFPLFALMIAVEAIVFARRQRAYPWADSANSLVIAGGYKIIAALNPFLVGWAYYLAHQNRLTTVPLDTWWGMALLFVGLEFSYYWFHRCSHECRWLWASHNVHHSPRELNFAAAYRLSWTSVVSGAWLFYLPMVWLGFDPRVLALALSLNLLYQFWLHTELIPKLGPFEWLFNTPSHHRVHHAINPRYLDTNYGGVLIVFDRLFGTFAEEHENEPCMYGLVKQIDSRNPLRIVFNEWLNLARDIWQAPSWRARFMYAFGPPGWSVDGSRTTTAALRAGMSAAR